MLSTLGISEFDERVYRAISTKPDRTAREIAEHLGTTPSRIRHAVARLVELGVLSREGHGQYRPVSPRTALSALLARRRADDRGGVHRGVGRGRRPGGRVPRPSAAGGSDRAGGGDHRRGGGHPAGGRADAVDPHPLRGPRPAPVPRARTASSWRRT